MANTTNTTSYLDPPSLIGRLNNDGTISLTPLELKRLNDFNYAVSKMIQGGLNLANLNSATNEVFTDLEGNVTTLQATAEGLQSSVADAEGKATTAQQTADGVKVEVDGLKSRNTVTIDSTGLYVTDATGKTTKLAGNHITSGTIQGVKLISTDGSRHVIINKGNIELGDEGSGTTDPAVIFYNTSSALLYMHCRDDIQISSAGGSISLVGDTEIKGDLNISRNINSSGVMKFDAGGNMSIDANDRIYIGGSNSGETIQIGTSGATINLIGNVTVNGVPYAPAGGGK